MCIRDRVEKGKIKARKVDDVTSANVEILVHLAPGTSSDKTMDALYAFSDCEINISPNCCVIEDNKPVFLTISDVLRHSVDRTMGLLRKELMIRKGELEEQLFFSSLERIFIEERIYKERKFEQSKSQDEVVALSLIHILIGTVEGEVLEEVSQTALVIILIDRTHFLCDVETGYMLRITVVTNVVSQSIIKTTYLHILVYRNSWHRCV